MRHSLPISPQFYVTAPQPCPYLEGREERKLFTTLEINSALGLNDILSHQGFRRSQNVIYRPSCSNCNACQSARVDVMGFKPSKSQKRIMRRNSGLQRSVIRPWASEDHFALFTKYLENRHADGGMAGMEIDEFAAMVEESPINTQLIEYKQDGEVVAVCLTDSLSDGLSMVYSFFAPELTRNSVGSFMILDHINMAKKVGLPFVYLGYWVQGSPKMDYKSNYSPLETFRAGKWRSLDMNADMSEPDRATDPIPEQVAAIHLPKG